MGEPIKKPALWKLLLEGRAIGSMGAYFASLPVLRQTQCGDGHPVMVLPGFLTSDLSTLPLRYFLQERGYSPHRWRMGRNVGNIDIEIPLLSRVRYLRRKYDQKVSLVGWSLGGVYARMIAQALPDDVKMVITLGSPFANITGASNVGWIYEVLSGKKVEELDPGLRERIEAPVAVPATAIYSKTDGIVPWQHCKEPVDRHLYESIEVRCSHSCMGHNPSVLLAIADRLSQPDGAWQPFQPTALQRLIYPAAV